MLEKLKAKFLEEPLSFEMPSFSPSDRGTGFPGPGQVEKGGGVDTKKPPYIRNLSEPTPDGPSSLQVLRQVQVFSKFFLYLVPPGT